MVKKVFALCFSSEKKVELPEIFYDIVIYTLMTEKIKINNIPLK